MCPIYSLYGMSAMPLNGEHLRAVCAQSGKSGSGTIIPENIATKPGTTRDIPSPEIVHSSDMLISAVIAVAQQYRRKHRGNVGEPGACTTQARCMPKNSIASTNIGTARSSVGAVRSASILLNQTA